MDLQVQISEFIAIDVKIYKIKCSKIYNKMNFSRELKITKEPNKIQKLKIQEIKLRAQQLEYVSRLNKWKRILVN